MPIAEMLNYKGNSDITKTARSAVFVINCKTQAPVGKSNQDRQRTYLDVVTELLQGDRAAAIRLFNYNKEKFGGKTDEWLWQKVIRDIERDRR